MSKFIFPKTLLKIVAVFALILRCNICISQCSLEIKNRDIEDISLITICLENDQFIEYTTTKTQGGKLFFEVKDFKKIRVSHIGYFDTSLLIKSTETSYSVLLRPKVVELGEVIIKKLQSFMQIEEKNRKGKNLLFNLEANRTWYFNVGLTKLGVKRLEEISIELNNSHKNHQIEVGFFENVNAAINSTPTFIDTIDLKKAKNNLLKIFTYKQNNVLMMDDFIIGIKLLLSEAGSPKHPIAVVTKFQENETQVYYQTERGILHKMPSEHYLKNFGAYPMLVSTIKYEK